MAKDGPAHTDIRTPHDGIGRSGNQLTGVVEFRGGMYEKNRDFRPTSCFILKMILKIEIGSRM